MTMSKTAVLIDANNRAWAAFHSYSRLTHNGKGVSMLYGLPSMLKPLITEFNPDFLALVWDGDRSKVRMKLHPEYKGTRKHKGLVDYDDFLRQRALVQKALYYLGVRQVYNPNCEADDLIAKLVKVLKKKGYDDIIIVSGDKDFHQLIGRYVRVFSESKKMLIHYSNCKEVFGYHPGQCVDYLTLVGDDGDNIKGYPGIGPKKASDFLDKYLSIAKFLESDDKHSIMNKKTLLELRERNEKLINLNYFIENYGSDLKIKFLKDPNPKINKKKFLALSAKFNMRKLMSDNFIKAFKQLQ